MDTDIRSSPGRFSAAAAEALLTRAFEDPADVLETSRRRLDELAEPGGSDGDGGTGGNGGNGDRGSDTDRIVSVLARAGGVAAREMYLIDVSRNLLATSIDAAARANDNELEGLAVMSLAATASYGGTDHEVFELMDRAQALLSGENLALALNQRAGLLQRSARYDEALHAFDEALQVAPTAGVPTLAGEILQNRGVLFGYLGDIDRGIADTTIAAAAFQTAGWRKRHADMIHNLGWLAGRRGDLVGSLRLFDEAAAEYRSLGIAETALAPDRCETLVAAGLLDEAATALNHWIAAYRTDGNDIGLGEALLSRSRVESARHNFPEALRHAAEAGHVFAASGRHPWVAVAQSLQLGATAWMANLVDEPHTETLSSAHASAHSDRLPDAALALVEPLRSAGLGAAATEAEIVAAELALRCGEPRRAAAIAQAVIERFGATRSPTDTLRIAYVQAAALQSVGDTSGAFETCATALHEYYAAAPLLGGTELRAHAGVRAERVGALCVALALALGDPQALLTAIESHRASALSCAPVLAPADDALAHLMNEHRALHAELVSEQRVASPAEHQRAASLRAEIRRRSRHVSGSRSSAFEFSTLDNVVQHAAASRSVIVEITSCDEALFALTIDGAGGRIIPLTATVSAVRSTVMQLGRALDAAVRAEAATRLRHDDTIAQRRHRAAQDAVVEFGALLSAALIDPVMAEVSHTLLDATLVIVPPSWMAPLPWAMLPSLSDTPFVVAPSIRLWLAHLASTPSDAPTSATVVVGPQIRHGAAEAHAVRRSLASAAVLAGLAATVEAVLTAMGASTVVHIACHGTFRSDNPMFSSLQFADGALFLYDLERQARSAPIVVLSACHAALGADRPGDELIGLVAVLLSNGTNSVIASVAPVDDSSETVAAMAAVHANLAAGMPAAVALHQARTQHQALRSFICFGSGTASLAAPAATPPQGVNATPIR